MVTIALNSSVLIIWNFENLKINKTINNVVNGKDLWVLAIEYAPTSIEKWLIFSD